jgi:hypothetical protein
MLIFAFILSALANPLLEEAVKPRGRNVTVSPA